MKNISWKTSISLFTWITRGENHNRPVNRRATIFTRDSFYKCKAIIICCLFELVLNRYWKILHKNVCYFKVYSRSILAIDTTFNIGQHYVTEMTYRDLRKRHLNITLVSWTSSSSSGSREKWLFKLLKDLAIIRTDECRELFNGILDEAQGNTGHIIGKEQVLKKYLEKTWIAFILVHKNKMDR